MPDKPPPERSTRASYDRHDEMCARAIAGNNGGPWSGIKAGDPIPATALMGRLQRHRYRRSCDLVRQVAELLITDPTGWSSGGGYWLSHEAAKVDIWIVNGAGFIKLRVWPIAPGFPRGVKPNGLERRLLWSLIKRRRTPTPENLLSDQLAKAVRHRLSP